MSYRIREEYFEWLYNLVCDGRHPRPIYRKLLMRLHNTGFWYSIRRDKNRAADGEDLRYRYAEVHDYDIPSTVADLDGPCTVLEMMVALSIKCEEWIMDDIGYGNRTAQWFWGMIVNLGLGTMVDYAYDDEYVGVVLDKFLRREYEPDGRGGLFRIRGCESDLRREEIWRQLLWYLNTL